MNVEEQILETREVIGFLLSAMSMHCGPQWQFEAMERDLKKEEEELEILLEKAKVLGIA